MIYRFDEFELDRSTMELRRGGEPVAVEPQVFALLLLLVENRDRLVSRDEAIERVWDGRIVSDAAVDSRVKSARRAVGDDGKTQRRIRTVHGRGFRFVGEVRETAPVLARNPGRVEPAPVADAGVKPSIAVLPFRLIGAPARYAAIADAIADELIAELSRLRWLFVIARGSTFRFRSAAPDLADVGRVLGAHYCLSGTTEVSGVTLAVTVELADTRDGGVVWADRFVANVADVHATRGAILARVVAALELQIPLHEAEAARLLSPDDLDAWAAYHLGLERMFRFNRVDNAEAGALFRRAVALAPRFARAHAGLSFVHFQNAFLRYTDDPAGEVRNARCFAERGVELDQLDPFANLTMGRSFWLEGALDASAVWVERATTLSPSYAQAIYARAWTHALSGRGADGIVDAERAMALSPLDPLYYAMAATRALSSIASGDHAEAARWADQAARSPGAHVLIAVVAVAAHALHGDRERAAAWAAAARARCPGITQADFFRSFPFADAGVGRRIASALATLDL